MDKVKERVKAVLVPGDSSSDMDDMRGHLYGAKLYDNARRKLIPVFGKPDGKALTFTKSDSRMIVAHANLEGRRGVYAVIPNSKRLGGFIPEKAYVFADIKADVVPGDLAVFVDADFNSLKTDETVSANIAIVKKDSKGQIYGQMALPDEKIFAPTMHKVIMFIAE